MHLERPELTEFCSRAAVPAFLADEADNRDPLLGPDRVVVERV